MSRKKQLSFFKPSPRQFGGSLLKGNPKEKRPLPVKGTLHLVLKSKRAFGARSMLAKSHVNQIDRIVRKQAKACGVKIYHFVNVGNHLHLVVRIESRVLYRMFIRSISGLIARQVLKKERGPQNLLENKNSWAKETQKFAFWVARPFSRLVAWGRDYNNLASYMQKNRNQANSFGTNRSKRPGDSVPGFDFPASGISSTA